MARGPSTSAEPHRTRAARLPVALRAALWVAGALLSFALMAVSVRELHAMEPLQIVFLRSVVSLLIVVAMLPRSGACALHTRRFGLHVVRNVMHFGGQYAWVYAIGALPLATVFAIEFTMPVWATLLAALLLRERLNQARWVMLAMGLAGVWIILRPGLVQVPPAAFVMLAGSFAYAATMIATKRLAGHDTTISVLFYMCAIQAPLGLLLALPGWVTPAVVDLPWLLVLGATGVSSHYCLTRAFRIADATLVVPFDFMRLPLIAVVGMALYGEPLELSIFLGAAVIFAGIYYSIRRESSMLRRPEPDEVSGLDSALVKKEKSR